MIFSSSEPHEIGSETDKFKGQLTDAIPNVKAVFEFSNPRSIAALIHSLIEVQKDMFRKIDADHQAMATEEIAG